jgi:hypothetical protein
LVQFLEDEGEHSAKARKPTNIRNGHYVRMNAHVNMQDYDLLPAGSDRQNDQPAEDEQQPNNPPEDVRAKLNRLLASLRNATTVTIDAIRNPEFRAKVLEVAQALAEFALDLALLAVVIVWVLVTHPYVLQRIEWTIDLAVEAGTAVGRIVLRTVRIFQAIWTTLKQVPQMCKSLHRKVVVAYRRFMRAWKGVHWKPIPPQIAGNKRSAEEMDDEEDQQEEVAVDGGIPGHWPLGTRQKPSIPERVIKKPKSRHLPVLAGDKRRAEEGQMTGPVL